MKKIVQQLRRLNMAIMIAMFLLLATGIVFIYSAASGLPGPSGMGLYEKQVGWSVIGLMFFLFFALTDYHHWTRNAWLLYAVGVLLLVLVFVPHVGLKMYGAKRWIQLAGMRIFQPAEMMKIAFVILLARLFGYPGRDVRRWRYALGGGALAFIPAALIVKQPDLGTALIFFPVLLAVMYVANVPNRIVASYLIAAGLVGVIFLSALLLPPRFGMSEQNHKHFMARLGLSPYQRERMLVFFDSRRDPLGSGWNRAQSQIAVGSGGLSGKGYMRGTQNILGFLPRTVAPTDFVFSVIAEETGFAGATWTIGLFTLLLYGGLQAAARAADKMGRLICAGVMTTLFCHIFINIAMTVGLVPVTGIPLPLISYGGTFTVCTMSALGIVQSVHIRGDWK